MIVSQVKHIMIETRDLEALMGFLNFLPKSMIFQVAKNLAKKDEKPLILNTMLEMIFS